MGSSPSKPTPAPVLDVEKFDSQIADRTAQLSQLTLNDRSPTTPRKTLDVSLLSKWEDRLLSDPKNRLAMSAFTQGDMLNVIRSREAVINDGQHVYSVKLAEEGKPVTNQRSSGRCWLFASTNVMRVGVIKKYKLAEFEYSQQYLFFWDKLEKANYFLECMIDLASEPLESRLVQHLLSSPVGDGGQFDMVINLVHKYGLVPQTVYPDVYSATASSRLNWLITTKLRENALILRELASSTSGEDKLLIAKAKMMEEIYGAMVIAFGRPPKPDEFFDWTYADKDGKYHRVKSTPTQFYKDSEFKAEEHFSLINDPRNEYNKLYTVDRLKNVSEGNGVAYVNTTLSAMKSVAIKMLKQNKPVFFGSDVGQFSNSQLGVMDTDLYDYKLGFNLSLKMTKAERIRVGSSAMTHAMVLTGVDLDEEDKPTKWRVENSWGSDAGKGGYFLMTDRWFDEYVYQVVVGFEDAPKELVEVFRQGKPVVLKAWDPMGALACHDGSCAEHCPLSTTERTRAKI